MAIDFKNQTPKNTLPANGVIFGADDPNSTSPSTYTKSALINPNTVTSVSGGTTGLTPSVPTNGDVVISGTLAVANGGTGVTTKTGTGNVVLSTNPTLVSPVLGTPASGDLTNCTNLPLTTGITGVLDETHGGTGQSSYTIGDLLYASSTTALSKLPDAATGNALISGGVGAPPAWGKVGLTTHVSGTLPLANGGTGVTSLSALQASIFPSQSGNSGKYLTTNGSTTSWAGSGQIPLFYDLVTDLRSVTPTAGTNAAVGGYYADGDGGGGQFYAVAQPAVFTGSITGSGYDSILVVTSVQSGEIYPGMELSDAALGIPAGTTVFGQISGTPGGAGSYRLKMPATVTFTGTVATSVFEGYISGTTLTITTLLNGTIAINQIVSGPGVAANTQITGGAGTSWTVNNSQTVGSVGSPVLMSGFLSSGAFVVLAAGSASGPLSAGQYIAAANPYIFGAAANSFTRVLLSGSGLVWQFGGTSPATSPRFAVTQSMTANSPVSSRTITGKFVDNGGSVIVPTGGDGTAAWVRIIDSNVSGLMFGAVNDNSVDSTSFLQKALDFAQAINAPLLIDGRFKITASLKIYGRIVGTTKDIFVVYAEGAGNGIYSTTSVTFFDSYFPFPNSPSTSVPFVEFVTFRGLQFESVVAATTAYVISNKFLRVRFENCNFESIKCLTSNIYIQSWYFDNCTMKNWGNGEFVLTTAGSFDIGVSGCEVEAATGGFVKLYDAANVFPPASTRFINNVIEGMTGAGIAIGSPRGLAIVGNYFEGVGITTNSPTIDLAVMENIPSPPASPLTAQGVFISGNFFQIANPGPTWYCIRWSRTFAATSMNNYCGGNLHDNSSVWTKNNGWGISSMGEFATGTFWKFPRGNVLSSAVAFPSTAITQNTGAFAIDASTNSIFRLNCSSGGAAVFSCAFPTGGVAGQRITIQIVNTTGSDITSWTFTNGAGSTGVWVKNNTWATLPNGSYRNIEFYYVQGDIDFAVAPQWREIARTDVTP